MKGKPAPVLERLFERFDLGEHGCWLWRGSLTRDGYGRIQHNGKCRMGHRVAYELLVGPVPEGLQLDHLCRVRHCFNPDHLEPVTGRENVMRGQTPAARNAAKTHCPNGHEYAGRNLVVRPDGSRGCYACTLERDRLNKRLRRLGTTELPVKTHCVAGHPYTDENVYTDPAGKRHCRICRLGANREWYRRNSAKPQP